jgi:hypothetical protein
MVNNGRITFDCAVNGQVGPVACIGNLFILEDPKSDLDGFGGSGAGFEELHAHLAGPMVQTGQ